MKKITTIILLAALMAATTSCKKDIIGEGPVVTETRSITGFSGIDLQMNGNVYYKNEPNWKVEVSAKQSIHGILETKLVNNKLVIRYHQCFRATGKKFCSQYFRKYLRNKQPGI